MLIEIIEDVFGIKLPKRSALWRMIYNEVYNGVEFYGKGGDASYIASIVASGLELKIKKYIKEREQGKTD